MFGLTTINDSPSALLFNVHDATLGYASNGVILHDHTSPFEKATLNVQDSLFRM